MRLATWNVNGLRARLDLLLHWLRTREPDVVGLQELKLTEEQFPFLELQTAGYHALVHGQKSWNGVAILSREPAVLVERGLPGQEALGARLISADVGGVRFSTVYVPNGKSVSHADYPLKLAWLDALALHLAELHGGRAGFVGGDFNVVPAALDSWNEAGLAGHIFHTDDERERLKRLGASGFVDLFRARYPEQQAFSWWDYRGGAFHKKQGLRIDLIYGTPALADRVKDVVIDRDFRKKQLGLTASDHAPVWVDLT
ncbi:MAG: exodeoxyribonuclease III [Polyangiaceae bacterium]